MSIEHSLAMLITHMTSMGENEMGDLTEEQAGLFHEAVDKINTIIDQRFAKIDQEETDGDE